MSHGSQMVAKDIIAMLSNLDPETPIYMSIDMERFFTPCPMECGEIEFGTVMPQIKEDGELVMPEDEIFFPKGFLFAAHQGGDHGIKLVYDPNNPTETEE